MVLKAVNGAFLCFAALCLSGCMQNGGLFSLNEDPGYQTVQTWPGLGGQTGLLQRNLATSLMSIKLTNTNNRASLGNFTDASIIQTLAINGEQGALIRGSSPGCPVKYVIFTADASTLSWTNPIGNCTSEFSYRQEPQGLVLMEQGSRDPEFFVYNQRRITGPILLSAIQAQNRSQQARGSARPANPHQQVSLSNRSPRAPSAPAISPTYNASAPQQASLPSVQPPSLPVETPHVLERVEADKLPPRAPEQAAPSTQWVPRFDPE